MFKYGIFPTSKYAVIREKLRHQSLPYIFFTKNRSLLVSRGDTRGSEGLDEGLRGVMRELEGL